MFEDVHKSQDSLNIIIEKNASLKEEVAPVGRLNSDLEEPLEELSRTA